MARQGTRPSRRSSKTPSMSLPISWAGCASFRTGTPKTVLAIPATTLPIPPFMLARWGGGTSLNIVPHRAEMQFEIRYLASDDPDAILSRIYELAGEKIDLEQTIAYPGLQTSPTARVTQLACSLAATSITTKVAFGTEAGFFDGLGIPTVVCGPGSMEGQGHKPDEFVTVEANGCLPFDDGTDSNDIDRKVTARSTDPFGGLQR